MKRTCIVCGKKTALWQRVNGSHWHCYDGCYSTTGWDNREKDGVPRRLKKEKQNGSK